MASLVGQQLKDAYDSLLKTSDNDALGGTYKQITDGAGNGSNLYLGTGKNIGIGISSPNSNGGANATICHLHNPTVGNWSGSHYTTGSTGSNAGDGLFVGTIASDSYILNYESANLLLYTSATERMRIHSGGDISFRDGATNEAFYWDASAGSLGIGTTSPLSALDVIGNIELQGNIKGKTTDNTQITIAQSGNYDIIASTRGVTASTIERLRIEGGADVDTISMINSNVGIGTTSPANILHIQGASDGGVIRTALFENSATAINSKSEIMLVSGGNTNRGVSIASLNESTSGQPASMIFSTSSAFSTPTERMRITSAGTIKGIGTYTASGSIKIFEAERSGGAVASDWSYDDASTDMSLGTSTAHSFSLKTSDTNRLTIDSSGNVGIGTASPLLTAANRGNVTINGATDSVLALGVSGGTGGYLYAAADRVELDAQSTRFLQFNTNGSERMRILSSGGITFNGDTSSANALDDYEEGTWTPTLEGATTAGTYTFSTNESLYTKIGRQVTVISRLIVDTASGGSGTAKFGGLPFTKVINSGFQGAVRLKNVDVDNSTINLTAVTWTYSATTEFAIATTLDNASGSGIDIAGISSGDTIEFSFTYFV